MFRRGKYRPNVLPLDEVTPDGFPSSDPFFHKHLLLAEGDSWFSIGGLPPTNLLYGLRFKKATMIVSCAKPGDTIANMAKISKDKDFKNALSQSDYKWDAVLLSGGGNDLIDAAASVVLPPNKRDSQGSNKASDYIDKPKLDKVMKSVEDGYRKIAELRDKPDSAALGKPIVTHTYDYTTPRNEPVRVLGKPVQGPWLYPAFVKRKVPEEIWIPLANHLIDVLAETLLKLKKGPNKIKNFHVVDTRGTLTPAGIKDVGQTKHWLNEIHPNYEGYLEIGRVVEREKLYQLLY